MQLARQQAFFISTLAEGKASDTTIVTTVKDRDSRFYHIKFLIRSGGRGRDRTYDQSIKSRMLYQLSYASIWFLLLEKEIGESLCMGCCGQDSITRLIKDNTACSVNQACKL
jgi:hypothetical protein